ncbi:dihydrodipicolinate synthase family protein [Pikeienuella piscinae]|uniref:Dihydrodipicolinate synthase family protein n=1 Tax=Pikeienuella piscinae TaxID=2748098 RepID=A0A7L5BVH4_9RHOB|nr:dihydrodipicolinate synthase family protein [Pikeienuella piscinae]QIE55742.1 dihydrodipicolinate synthase family protein [Pikeienuella piscinae]
MSHDAPRGVVAPNFTPFNDDLTIATDLYIGHALELLDQGCVALAPFGTTGEATSVGVDERIATLAALIAAGADPARLIPGTGLTSIADSARLTRACLGMGCAGAMALPPFYYKNVPEDGLYDYYARLIEAVDYPGFRLYLYHIPQISGVGLPVALVERLFTAFEEVVGIKDSSGDWANTEALLAIDGLVVFPSAESALAKALPLGAPGCITATANLNAPAIAELIAAHDADPAKAAALQPPVTAFRKTAQAHPLIEAQKRVKALMTGEPRWANVRPPLRAFDPAAGAALARELGLVA